MTSPSTGHDTSGDIPGVLLIGEAGMLGLAWIKLLESRGIPFDAPTLDEIDFTRPDSIRSVLAAHDQPVVVNCAAYTDVDQAETDLQLAREINVSGFGVLVDCCAATGRLLVHYSTDYVFDGQGTAPYPTDHPIAPVNAYGRTKAQGDELLRQSVGPSLLIRTSWLYAPWAKNFDPTIAKLAAERPSLRVVNDQRGTPTSAEHLAATSSRLIEHGARGVHHVTDGGECTWYDFAAEIARHVNPQCRVEPCTSDEYPRPAKRPAYSVLDVTTAEALVGPMPGWRHNLASVLARLP